MAVTQGEAVLAAIEREAGWLLAEHGFGDDGQPKPKSESSTTEALGSAGESVEPPKKPEPRPRLAADQVLAAWNKVAQDMRRRGFTAEPITAAQPKIVDGLAVD